MTVMTGLKPLLLFGGYAAAASVGLPVKLDTRSPVTSRLANVHFSTERTIEGPVSVTYGPCSSTSPLDAHHLVGEVEVIKGFSKRLVWVLPEIAETGGCLSAWSSSGTLLGRSVPQELENRHLRRAQKRAASISMDGTTGIDTLGPWFDGVAVLKDKQPGAVDVEAAKNKQIAIVGAGMSGLMSYLVLTQAGMKNVTILEASQRLGGRVHTEYLSGGPFDYSYQEMGPMRFPVTYQDPESKEKINITDHQLVFQLADELNALNGNDKNLSVNFIKWVQSNPKGLVYRNGFKLPSGLPPTAEQIRADPSLSTPPKPQSESVKALSHELEEAMPDEGFYTRIAKNMFKAHKEWTEKGLKGLGGDTWSEFAYLMYHLNATLQEVDALGALGSHGSIWAELYEGMYFSAVDWVTIDGGLNRLPLAFAPIVGKDTYMGRKIERISYTNDSKVNLVWRDVSARPIKSVGIDTSRDLKNATFDYAIVGAPFSVVRSWRLPSLPTPITNAINRLPYQGACKVALEYSERFWEKAPYNIFGGCGTSTDIPGVGSICYPSYNFNGTGPATLLASYTQVGWVEALNEEEHVKYILDAITEIHGEETRKLFTGRYDRRCWNHDPLQAGAWANPSIGQHQMYIPEYFKTYNGLIFVGEHTSYTHAWIAAALESGIRGSVQLLLDLGLVDEAKAAVNKWMARWIDI
ncbi:hypothetical protein VTJ04DRAFT_2253 [Mycothermus thermophilus]|uniref:uncharacterized protein n=1 Tax=Humicola insolens TaxID=85995 RepID=UPI0037440F47